MAGEKSEESISIAQRLRERLRSGTAAILSPPRMVVVISLGGSVLFARALRNAFDQAAEEGERQLERFNGSLGGATSRLWRRDEKQEAKT